MDVPENKRARYAQDMPFGKTPKLEYGQFNPALNAQTNNDQVKVQSEDAFDLNPSWM